MKHAIHSFRLIPTTFAIILLCLVALLFTNPPYISAQEERSCGDRKTVGYCGEYSGCSAGQECQRNILSYRCVDNAEKCSNVQYSYEAGYVKCGDLGTTNNKCGPNVGCEMGYKCVRLNNVYRCIQADPDNEDDAVCLRDQQLTPNTSIRLQCGQATTNPNQQCGCNVGPNDNKDLITLEGTPTQNRYCCGYSDSETSNNCYTAPPTPPPPISTPLSCGQTTTNNVLSCNCMFANNSLVEFSPKGAGYCCGQINNNLCFASLSNMQLGTGGASAPIYVPSTSPPPSTPPVVDNDGNQGSGGTGGTGGTGGGDDQETDSPDFNVFDSGPTSDNFRELNPLSGTPLEQQLSSPGGIIGRILQFGFPLAGLILFAMIVWGGFEMLTSAATSKGMDAGRQRVTNAIIGFMILFSSYWIIQIVQAIFGVAIL